MNEGGCVERKIKEMLFGNRGSRAGALPLVHTAPAYFIQKILQSKEIRPRPCDVFLGEQLAYFFVGRLYLAGDGLRILGADGAEVAGRLAATACPSDLGLAFLDPRADLRRLKRYE